MSDYKIFFASDIHGSERCFLKFVNAAKFFGAQALVLGGDVTGKVLVPIVRRGGGYDSRFLGQPVRVEGEGERAELEKRVRVNGFYPYVCDPDEYARLEADEAYMREVFRRVMRDSVARWIELAEERLKGSGVTVAIMPGNDDDLAIDDVLDASPVSVNHDGRAVALGDYEMVGFSYVNPTPWNSPRELDEEGMARRIEEIVAQASADRGHLILNFHAPPYRSQLDNAPRLTQDLRVVRTGGEPEMAPVGSVAVRQALERYQPLLALHGHIHESRGAVRIGPTLAINPGSDYGEGVLRAAIVTLRGTSVRSHQIITG
ncbi:MAG: metallophosphoesterase [Firmicutes bacterium]|nr:metallophosphoesterase [Bacillota bacterium]